VIAGDAQLTFGTPPSVLPMVQAGRLKALAVTSPNRSSLVPDVPGTIEAGLPAYNMSFWYGFFVPVGTPSEVTKKLFDAAQQVMQRAEVKAALAREGPRLRCPKSPEDSRRSSTTTTASGPAGQGSRREGRLKDRVAARSALHVHQPLDRITL
jgi:tripartite-type tricarboxylate transporter receptor subunit TctC